jgi:hypothetical protein
MCYLLHVYMRPAPNSPCTVSTHFWSQVRQLVHARYRSTRIFLKLFAFERKPEGIVVTENVRTAYPTRICMHSMCIYSAFLAYFP